ncbi:GDSL-type esterase/lipase family protein [Daejeonella sp.]|uniref:SGNH/GDSL hydrolase family protein n=1 Tax=Daejeonella sp. TaxID=2805397 RepID=UPI0027303529|nr:GDSL-type esterase/lipase family protein [Daejeonella sp.]MDP2413387.1 GDSL-type esterase/lipase family protein [Daejeonella sp.]
MKNILLILFLSFQTSTIADPASYLNDLKAEMKKEWPKNRTINLVFHGHSVPAGYFKTPVVNTLEAYPYQVLRAMKAEYPFAVINIINTSIGGENSESGDKRFETEVLNHKPDVLFIDYALNDQGIGLERAKIAWEKMISIALKKEIKVILISPSPDQRVNILEVKNVLEQHTAQIRSISEKYGIGFVDSYRMFKQKVVSGEPITKYMSQVNHPNENGHELIANGIMRYF